MVGFHSFGRPSLLINDLDLAKQILITDFDQFTNRKPFEVKVFHAQYDDIFRKLLVTAEGEEWKQIRSLLSPIYTSAKLREGMKLWDHLEMDIVSKIQHRKTFHVISCISTLIDKLSNHSPVS